MNREEPNRKIDLVRALSNGDRRAFETIYREMAAELLQHIYFRVHDKEVSEELVQDIFLSLWNRRAELDVRTDLRAYLYGAAKFQVLNFIRSEQTHRKYIEHLGVFAATQGYQSSAEQSMYAKELSNLVRQHMQQLPDKCRQAFHLSRFEQKTIAEIAEEMNISPRTVENYLTRALKHLREALSRYAWLLVMVFIQLDQNFVANHSFIENLWYLYT